MTIFYNMYNQKVLFVQVMLQDEELQMLDEEFSDEDFDGSQFAGLHFIKFTFTCDCCCNALHLFTHIIRRKHQMYQYENVSV